MTEIDAALAEAFREEPPCPYCQMVVQTWVKGTCGADHCLWERAKDDDGNRRYEEYRDRDI